jgi:two-component system chemotaxis response regulator CheY
VSPTEVLVVDDHLVYRELFVAMVRSCFPLLQIATASDGSTALQRMHDQRFALVILDYQLPTLSGGDVVRHLRTRTERQGALPPPIVLMSTHPDLEHLARMLRVDAFLAKPTTADAITAALEPLLPRTTARSAIQRRLWRIAPG